MAMKEIFHSKTAMPLCPANPVIEINHEREVRPQRNTAKNVTGGIHSELDKKGFGMFNCLILTHYRYAALPTSTSSDFANGSEIISDSVSLNNDASGDQEVSSELTGNSADEIAVSHFEADELAGSFPAKKTIDYQEETHISTSCDACKFVRDENRSRKKTVNTLTTKINRIKDRLQEKEIKFLNYIGSFIRKSIVHITFNGSYRGNGAMTR
ncbi:hypothetical protein AWC38_SpisGene3156 [Stylophora pistillata]|uniref:Uncharacterized protein n=1 Tax=Stylophora pistillata TaxID=50429 RepID=A0A2B4SMX0_STYPI|nr:hypothetical protein AWC38_SpisGene3156 [Stylophora pistillata]